MHGAFSDKRINQLGSRLCGKQHTTTCNQFFSRLILCHALVAVDGVGKQVEMADDDDITQRAADALVAQFSQNYI